MNIVRHFPAGSIKFELGKKDCIFKRLYFNDFLWKIIFKMFQILMKYATLERILPSSFLFETFASSWLSLFVTITKPLSNKTGQTICEGLKWMGKLFEITEQKDLKKPVIFLKFSMQFIKELAQKNTHQFCLASFSESGILGFLPLSYNKNNLSVKFLNSLCQDILLCKS